MKASTRFVRITTAALAVAFVLTLGAGGALATPLTIKPGTTTFMTPANNDYFGKAGNPGVQYGFLGSNLELSAGNWTVTYTYLFKEAGFTNWFGDDGTANRFITGSTSTGATFLQTYSIPGGGSVLLDFKFKADVGGSNTVIDNKGTNPLTGPAFFLSMVGNSSGNYLTTGSSAYIALDDQLANDDDNHDDLIVRVDVADASIPVPDPMSSLAALGLGLLSLGSLKRRLGK